MTVTIRLELAQITILRSAVRRLHLHSQHPRVRFDSDIVCRRISPRLRHLESMFDRLRHETQLHPLAPLLESPESLALSHLSAPPVVPTRPKRKGATHGPRLLFFNLYPIFQV